MIEDILKPCPVCDGPRDRFGTSTIMGREEPWRCGHRTHLTFHCVDHTASDVNVCPDELRATIARVRELVEAINLHRMRRRVHPHIVPVRFEEELWAALEGE